MLFIIYHDRVRINRGNVRFSMVFPRTLFYDDVDELEADVADETTNVN